MLNLFSYSTGTGLNHWAVCLSVLAGSVIAVCAETQSQASPPLIELRQNENNRWQLIRNGQPCTICGGGGQERLDLFAQLGGNSVRTWGLSDLEETDDSGSDLMDRAHQLGLTVVAGIWVGHPRHGFDYNDKTQVAAQRKHIRNIVHRYKNHPALLLWGLGNEVEMQQSPDQYPQLFSELNELARIVKEEDPNHPVMTSIIGADPKKIQAITEYYPQLDILGINSYGAARLAPQKITASDWKGPYILSEFGPNGPWESPKTSWGVPIEPTPEQKMEMVSTSYEANAESPQCVGLYAFRWGSKQEFTSTWFGLLLPTGEKTPVVDYLSKQWTGCWPTNRSPQIESIRFAAENSEVRAGSSHTIRINVSDFENDPITLSGWVMEESRDTGIGGDVEQVPPKLDHCFEPAGKNTLSFTAPGETGEYRAFIKAADRHGGACVYPFPFRVKQDPSCKFEP